jgi:hypothetical protein
VDDPSWVCDDSPKNVEKNHHTVYLILLGIISNIQMNMNIALPHESSRLVEVLLLFLSVAVDQEG